MARDGFDYVFVVTPDNQVQQRQVELGARTDDKVQVLKGIGCGRGLGAQLGGFLVDGDVVSGARTSGVASAPASAASLARAGGLRATLNLQPGICGKQGDRSWT